MTAPATPGSSEHTARGLALTLAVIPFAIIVYAIAGSILGLGFFIGFVTIAIPTVAGSLYSRGAGAPISRANAAPWIAITAVAIALGIITGVVAGAWNGFLAVGGDGGILGSPFLTTLRTQFTTNFGDTIVPIAIAVALGFVGIAGVLRGPRTPGTGYSGNRLTPEQTDELTGETPSAAEATAATTTADDATAGYIDDTQESPHAAPTTEPTLNAPSPGIILNGEPYDPNKQ